ncbi:G-type lectin S-receptor-like serine/threonine-protein kinase At1g61370 [Ziziphus jujuba]|uniref:Receptor-like serine/threonine-protein kinase n=1 Tax=Ziziphus jujuba TaxID=326968 RepID=A0ABM3ZWH1_ZIZJJ|nr:G-type lectin S-receptor-like serine/threonine-protein kinase At1g61370 [Ziziphus jujuba]
MSVKERESSLLRLFILLLIHLFPAYHCYAIYNITFSQPLSQGQTLVSPSQIFELGFFTPNNSTNQYIGIWYKENSPRKRVVWVANRENPLAVTDSSANLTISSNGNLNLVDGKGKSVWSTDIVPGSNGSVAVLFDNGSFVLTDGVSGQFLWQSFDHPGNTLLTKAQIFLNVKTKERNGLTSWKTENDPSLGDFMAVLSGDRPPQAFIWNGSVPHWRSGPWDKSKFNGVPQMDPSYLSGFKLVENLDMGTVNFTFDPYNTTSLYYLFLSSQGVLRLMKKTKKADWSSIFDAPNSTCDVYAACGPFAVCKPSESPICKCLKGFVPKSNDEWSRGNWKRGCIRRTELLCEKNTSKSASSGGKNDGFWKSGMVKLPNFHEYLQIIDPNRCSERCQTNCSCIAYAFVNGIGCLVWSKELVDIQEFPFGGQDLFVRLAHAELVGNQLMKRKLIIIFVAISIGVILSVMFIAWYRWRAKRKGNLTKDSRKKFDLIETSENTKDTSQSTSLQDPLDLAMFDFDSIVIATNSFSETNKLGQGGFGSVYKGKLEDGKEVAIKRLSSNSGQGIKEFKNEMLLISKLQHRNLVKLLGCCTYEDEKLIIYEFMPNKSLDFLLFDPKRRSELNWAARFNIIQGVAKGLVYLHRDSYSRVIHRDLKASNILLDAKMNPKISDFGLARIFQETIDLATTHRIVGTIGYMAPEYAMGGIFSEKSDVYSFGVLLLEIVSGMKNNSFHHGEQKLSIIVHAWQLWSQSRALDLMDEALANSFSSSEVVRCIDVGLLCAQDNPMDRPTMAEVVFMLSNETDRPKPKRPLFYFQNSMKFDFDPPSGKENCSTNEASKSIVEAR